MEKIDRRKFLENGTKALAIGGTIAISGCLGPNRTQEKVGRIEDGGTPYTFYHGEGDDGSKKSVLYVFRNDEELIEDRDKINRLTRILRLKEYRKGREVDFQPTIQASNILATLFESEFQPSMLEQRFNQELLGELDFSIPEADWQSPPPIFSELVQQVVKIANDKLPIIRLMEAFESTVLPVLDDIENEFRFCMNSYVGSGGGDGFLWPDYSSTGEVEECDEIGNTPSDVIESEMEKVRELLGTNEGEKSSFYLGKTAEGFLKYMNAAEVVSNQYSWDKSPAEKYDELSNSVTEEVIEDLFSVRDPDDLGNNLRPHDRWAEMRRFPASLLALGSAPHAFAQLCGYFVNSRATAFTPLSGITGILKTLRKIFRFAADQFDELFSRAFEFHLPAVRPAD